MNRHTVQIILAAVAVLAFSTAWGQSKGKKSDWQDEFAISSCNMATTGRNPYFVHLYRAGLDGKNLTLLSPEDATHDVSVGTAGFAQFLRFAG